MNKVALIKFKKKFEQYADNKNLTWFTTIYWVKTNYLTNTKEKI